MEVEKKIEDINLIYILKKSIPISLNFFLDKLPFTITLIIFKNLNQTKNQETIALIMSYINFSFAHLQNIQEVIGIKCSKCYGRKNYKQFWDNFFNFCLINYILLILSFLAIFFSNEILTFAKVDDSIINIISPLLKKIFILKVIENFNMLLRGISIAQKITHIFFYTNISNFIIFLTFNYITIIKLNLGLDGFLISFYIKTITECFMLIFLLVKNNKIPFSSPNLKILKNFKTDLKYALNILFAKYGVLMSIESCTYYATLTNNQKNINAWYFYFNSISYIFYISVGGLSIFRTYISYAFGQKDKKKFEKTMKKLFFYIIAIKSFFGILYGIFPRKIASIFTNDEETIQIFVFCLRLYVVQCPIGVVIQIYRVLLNIIGYEFVSFRGAAFLLPGIMIPLGYFLGVYLGYGVRGLAVNFFIAVIFYTWYLVRNYYLFKDRVLDCLENSQGDGIDIELISK